MPQVGMGQVVMYQRTEIRAILADERLLPVTMTATATVIPAGTVLGRITASGLYAPYAAANTDGTQTAKVILADDVDPSTGTQLASVYLCGIFKKDKLTGLDAGSITALGAREPLPNVLVIPGC